MTGHFVKSQNVLWRFDHWDRCLARDRSLLV